MPYDRITSEVHPEDDRIQVLRLDAPERNNVIDLTMLLELQDAIESADRDGDVQAILLGSTGEVFCAGADVNELADLGFEAGARWMTAYLETLEYLRDTGKPVIAAVEGTCVAGGNELVMATDVVVAGREARFGQPEVGVGSTAAGGGVQLLPLMVGEKRAKDLLLTGRLLEAEEAKAIGLISRVVDSGDAEARALELTRTIVENSSPQAYRLIKAMLKPWTNLGMVGEEMARDITARTWASDEFGERVEAFRAGEDFPEGAFDGVRPGE